jgi:hypothetical protein
VCVSQLGLDGLLYLAPLTMAPLAVHRIITRLVARPYRLELANKHLEPEAYDDDEAKVCGGINRMSVLACARRGASGRCGRSAWSDDGWRQMEIETLCLHSIVQDCQV